MLNLPQIEPSPLIPSITGDEFLPFDSFRFPRYAYTHGATTMHLKETKVRLTEETRQRIEALVGANRRAAFIREAIENELKRRGTDSERGK